MFTVSRTMAVTAAAVTVGRDVTVGRAAGDGEGLGLISGLAVTVALSDGNVVWIGGAVERASLVLLPYY